RDRLLRHPTPWLPAGRWNQDWQGTEDGETVWEIDPILNAWRPDGGEDLATFLILYLPYFETAADRPAGLEYILDFGETIFDLGLYRREGSLPAEWLNLPDEAHRFLRRW